MPGMDYEKIKKHCESIGAQCHKCEYVVKVGVTKGMCKVRDSNGLYPNQYGYGDTF